jgi:hypothetical protein
MCYLSFHWKIYLVICPHADHFAVKGRGGPACCLTAFNSGLPRRDGNSSYININYLLHQKYNKTYTQAKSRYKMFAYIYIYFIPLHYRQDTDFTKVTKMGQICSVAPISLFGVPISTSTMLFVYLFIIQH